MKVVRRAILIVACAGTLGGAATGFGGDLLFDGLSGWVLVAHLALSPLVMLGFAAVAIVWGKLHRFDRDSGGLGVVRKVLFWLLLLFALASMVSMLAAMLPIFGYIGQDWLRILHDWSGIGLVAAGLLYWWSVRRNERVSRNGS